MGRDYRVGVSLLAVALAWSPPGSRGADPAAEVVMESKGLERSGRAYVIEAEDPVLAKMKEARASFAEYAALADRQAVAQRTAAHAADLEERRSQLQEELDAINDRIASQGSSQPGAFGRPGGMNLPQGGMFSPMTQQRDPLKYALAEVTREQRALKNQSPQGKDRSELDRELMAKAEAFKATLEALRPQVDAVVKTYAELGADESVQKALTDLKKASPTKLRIGPSDAFLSAVKELEQAEGRFLGKKTTVVARKRVRAKK